MSLRIAAPSFLVAAALACAGDPTAPSTSLARPSLSAAQRAPDEPNVWRFQDQFVFFILDPETDLIAIAGLPDDPVKSTACGGDAPFATLDFHVAGVRQQVYHFLVEGHDVNMDVYRLSTFVDICESVPLASGAGRVMYTDSDGFATGSGADSWGFRMEGEVSLASTGTAHLMAHNRWQILPDGTLRRIFRTVRLNRS